MIHLIRHAEAADIEPDERRPLTPNGRQDAARLGKFLRGSGALRGAEFWHSTLARARETAEIVAEELGAPHTKLRQVEGFAPDDSPGDALRQLAAAKTDVAVFGHNPQLTRLASLMIRGEAGAGAVVFEKCAALALEKGGSGKAGNWFVRWHIAPGLLRAS